MFETRKFSKILNEARTLTITKIKTNITDVFKSTISNWLSGG